MEDRAVALGGQSTAEALKVPPQSVEAEQSVLGGLMLEGQAWDRVADKITEADFYRKEHRLIFRAIGALAEESSPADVVTVSEWLDKHQELQNAGGLAYLASLANNTPSAANIGAYANIVRERAILRNLIHTASRIAGSAYSPEGQSASDILDFAERSIFDISEQGAHRRGGFSPLKTLLTKAVDRIDTLFRSESAITGVSTGFKDLDDMTSGLQPGDLVIVAGRPSMGKTSLAMNIAESAAVGSKLPVAIFSMEMPGEQLAMRMMASLGRINAHKVRTGKLEDDDWPRLTHAIGMLAEAPMFIDDTPALTPLELRTRARRLKREHGLGHDRGGLLAAHAGAGIEREPRHRNIRHHAFPERPGQGAGCAGDCALAAESQPGAATQQAPGDVRPARIRRHRAGCGRDPVHLPR